MDLSIIIPCYNSEKYLKNCLNSFCNQIKRYNKIEVILVNDSSTDGTSKILKSYGKKFKFIKILKNKKNLGVSLSRNLAINRSRGNYILFLDSDDEIIKNSILSLLKLIKKNNRDIIVLRNKNIGKKDPIDKNQIFNLKKKSKSLIDNIENFNLFRATCWNFLVKRDFIIKNKILFKNIKIFEDQFFVSKILIEAKSFTIFKKPVYNRRLQEPRTLSKIVGFSAAVSCLKVIIELAKVIYQYKKDNKNKIKFLISRLKFVENIFLENLIICKKNNLRYLVDMFYINFIYLKNLKKFDNQLLKFFFKNKKSIVRKIEENNKNKIKIFKNSLQLNKSFLIFCAWYYSEIILRICSHEKIKVDFIIDNNVFYKFKRLHKKKIILPSQLKKFLNKNYSILICNKNKKYRKQIVNQLVNLGFKPKDLIKVEI